MSAFFKAILIVLMLGIFGPVLGAVHWLDGVGVKGGLSFSTQGWENYHPTDPNTNRRVGFDLGFHATLFDIPFFRLAVEGHYVQKGFREKVETKNADRTVVLKTENFDHRVDYLSFHPLGITVLQTRPINPYILIGPSIDFKIADFSEQNRLDSMLTQFEPVVISIVTGAGIELVGVAPVDMVLEFRYNFDISKSYKSDNQRIIHEAWMLLVGVRF